MTTQTTPNSTEQYETIKLGIDAHAQEFAFASAAPEALRTGTGVGSEGV